MAISEAQRRWRASPQGKATRAAQRKRRYESPDGLAAIKRYKTANPVTPEQRMRDKHGMRPEDWSAMWDAQDGRCYLCGGELAGKRAPHVDHDHSCCPERESCAYCRRGLACPQCNIAIGMAADDPDRLRRMADNLEAAKLATAARIASKPVQGMLDATG